MTESIRNSAVDPDIGMRRSGGSNGDPHGGHEHMENEWRNPEANPVEELVPGGAGGVSATRTPVTTAATDFQKPNLAPPSEREEAHKSLDEPILRNDNKMRMDPETGLPVKK